MKFTQVQVNPRHTKNEVNEMVNDALNFVERSVASDREQVDKEYYRTQSILQAQAEIERATLQTQAEAEREITRLKEEQSRVRIDTYSDAKGREQNAQYGEYLSGSIQENFEEQIRLAQERANLIREIAELRSQLQIERTTVEMELLKMKTEAENEVARKRNEADLMIENAKREIKEMKTSKAKTITMAILCPLSGIALGVLSYVMLWVFGVGI